MLPNNWRSEWYSRLKCDHGFIKKYIFFVHLLFHVATTSTNHNRNHNQICICYTLYSITDRGAECNRPIPKSGAMTIFLFFVFGRKCRVFLFSLFFGPKMKLLFRYFLFFGRKKKILLRSASNDDARDSTSTTSRRFFHDVGHRTIAISVAVLTIDRTRQLLTVL